jgi:hypothetical protein
MKRLITKYALFVALGTATVTTCFAQRPNDQPDMKIDKAAQTQVIDSLTSKLKDQYVFPEVAEKMGASLREHAEKGDYDQISSATAFAQQVTRDLQAISHDKHLHLNYSAEVLPPNANLPSDSNRKEPSPAELEKQRRFYDGVNYGFEKLERMRGNIGYMDLRGFADARLAGDTLAAAMNFLGHTDALIIDLRQNGGGDPAMVSLVCSYLFGREPVHVNDLYWREGNRTEEFWTKADIPGMRYEGKDVYVLTSNRTFSGGEEFAYDMKNLKRATLIGETTGGGANPGGEVRLADHFNAFIPTGRAVSPITKTNWEGVGVKPDIDVPKEQALKAAYIMALNKLAEKNADPRLKAEYKRVAEETQKELDQMKLKPASDLK